jgi:hypothetical protein
VLVEVSITEIVLSLEFVTYTFVPSGEPAIVLGVDPTGSVAVTVFGFVLITETVSSLRFVTYTFVPSGLTATPVGLVPTFIVVVITLLTELDVEAVLSLLLLMCANGAAYAVLNNIKTIAAEIKAKKHDFRLSIKYFNSFLVSFVSNIRRLFGKIWNINSLSLDGRKVQNFNHKYIQLYTYNHKIC